MLQNNFKLLYSVRQMQSTDDSRVHLPTVLTLLFLCLALMFLISVTMCVYSVCEERTANVYFCKGMEEQQISTTRESQHKHMIIIIETPENVCIHMCKTDRNGQYTNEQN